MRAVRGATTVAQDTPHEIREATLDLIGQLAARNQLSEADVVSAIFTVTPDLRSLSPASALPQSALAGVPVICISEIDVEGALPRCIRALLHVDRSGDSRPLAPVYLRGAVSLRPDLVRQDGE
jgi:chorismate mutase